MSQGLKGRSGRTVRNAGTCFLPISSPSSHLAECWPCQIKHNGVPSQGFPGHVAKLAWIWPKRFETWATLPTLPIWSGSV